MQGSDLFWEAKAAWESGTIDRWFQLDPYTRAFIIATHQTLSTLEAMKADEV